MYLRTQTFKCLEYVKKGFQTNKDTVPSFVKCVQLKDKQTQIHLKPSDSKKHPTEREVKRPSEPVAFEQGSMFCDKEFSAQEHHQGYKEGQGGVESVKTKS